MLAWCCPCAMIPSANKENKSYGAKTIKANRQRKARDSGLQLAVITYYILSENPVIFSNLYVNTRTV